MRPEPLQTGLRSFDLGARVTSPPLLVSSNAGDQVPRLVVVYARGAKPGGIVALDLNNVSEVWRHEVGEAVPGGVSRCGNRLVFGDASGRLHGCGVDGRQRSTSEYCLPNAVTIAPTWLGGRRALVFSSGGWVARVDVADLQVMKQKRLPPTEDLGQLWAPAAAVHAPSRGVVVGAADGYVEGGCLLLLDPEELAVQGRYVAGAAPLASPVLTAAPSRAVFAVGRRDYGALLALDMDRWSEALPRFELSARIRVKPTLAGDRLFVVAHDRRLHMVDASSLAAQWSRQLEHSATCAPLVLERHGMVVVGDSHGRMTALELEAPNSPPLWCLPEVHADPCREERPAPIVGLEAHQDLVVAVTSAGEVHILPWWGGNLEWLERRALRAGDVERRAFLLVVGASQSPKRPALRRVAGVFTEAGRWEDAARVYEAAEDRHEAAEAFERAGRWLDAARVWLEIPVHARAARCRKEHRLANACPHLEFGQATYSLLKVGHKCSVTVRIRNASPYKARALAAKAMGDIELLKPAEKEYVERRELAPGGDPWDVTVDFKPRSPGLLDFELWVRYVDDDNVAGCQVQTCCFSHDVAGPDQPPIVNVTVERYAERVIIAQKYAEGDQLWEESQPVVPLPSVQPCAELGA